MRNSKTICIAGSVFFLVLCVAVTGCVSAPEEDMVLPSASIHGVFYESEREFLIPVFNSSVNTYLRRYGSEEISRTEDYIHMTAIYDYQLDIELFIHEREYEIKVTIAQDNFNEARAEKICTRIATGTSNTFTKNLTRGSSRGSASSVNNFSLF